MPVSKQLPDEVKVSTPRSLISSALGHADKIRRPIALIILFLALDVGILLVNFSLTSKLEHDSVAINLAGRQRMLVQKILNDLLILDQVPASQASPYIKDLKKTTALFDSVMRAFKFGGDVQGGSGEMVHLYPSPTAKGQQLIRQADGRWLEVSRWLAPYVSNIDVDHQSGLKGVISQVMGSSSEMLKLMNAHTSELEHNSISYTESLRFLQFGLALLSFVVFLLILRRLQQHNAGLLSLNKDLAVALQENHSIKASLESQVLQRTIQLQHAVAEANRANEAKSEFLSNTSHEIRTPMNAILGFAYLLERMKLSGEAGDLVAKIRSAGQSLHEIINDILDFSKIEAGQIQIEQVPFLLSDVLDSLSVMMSVNVGEKNIEVAITPPVGVNKLYGDELRLKQVLINLVSNAIKFTERGHVEVIITVVDKTADDISLLFKVTDTGIGIPPEVQPELFSPFTQADASTTRRFGGTGLGLAISSRLVALMGGKLDLRSVVGQGTEFCFTLTFPRHEDIAYPSPAMANLEVLIADDNQIALNALGTVAESLGWKARLMNSGDEAVRQAQSIQGDDSEKVIVLDWKMPGMDGLEAACAIRESLSYTPIILMATAYSQDALRAEPHSELVDGILGKPVTASALYDAVAGALQARQSITVAEQPVRVEPVRLHGVRVLVVDDSEINRDLARRILEGEGAKVTLADNGKEAVDWLFANGDAVDIVLMDVQMPVMDGYEATRLIRSKPQFDGLPIVALTAGVFKQQQIAAAEAGMSEFIAKPFDVDIAVEKIRRLTGVGGAPVPDAESHVVDASTASLAALSIDQGLKIWGDAEVYKQYLHKFIDEYAASIREISQMESDAQAALVHKLKGAASSLGLEQLAALSGEADQQFHETGRAENFSRLREAMDSAIDSIRGYSGQ